MGRGGPVLHRFGDAGAAERVAASRRAESQHPQRAPAICHHLVWAGGRAGRDVRALAESPSAQGMSSPRFLVEARAAHYVHARSRLAPAKRTNAMKFNR